MDTMKTTLTIFLLLQVGQLLSQSTYQSIFSNDTTRWHIFECAADAGGTYVYYCYSDTTINSKEYRVLFKEKIYYPNQTVGDKNSYINGYLCGFIREDTVSGKTWIINDYAGSEDETLLMDLSLNKGDYFPIYINGQVVDSTIVDSVYLIDNKRIVELDANNSDCCNIYPIRFIEGIGPSSGFEEIGPYFLLCKFNDGEHVYSTESDRNINCFIEGAGDVPKNPFEEIKVFPNQANDKLSIITPTIDVHKITIYDLSGVEIDRFEINSLETTLDISNYKAAIYLIKINTTTYHFLKK